MEAVKPFVTVIYDGKDITSDLSPTLISVTYTDDVDGKSDEVNIAVTDSAGLWKEGWYPTKGSTLTVSLGIGSRVMPCGDFEIDEIDCQGPPDTVTMRALAAGVKKANRTKNSEAFEESTLKDIAGKIAAKHGFTVQGTIKPVKIKRLTQYRQEDLTFLRKLSLEYGHTFAVRGKKLVFSTLESIESKGAVKSLTRSDMTSYRFRDKALETYKAANVKYHNPLKNEVMEGNESASASDTSADTLEVRTKAEDATQAKEKANAALHQANGKKVEASFSMPGDPDLCAGVNVNITGFGTKLSGKYHILRSRHMVDASGGYSLEIECKKIG